MEEARAYSLDVLLEAHDEDELRRAVALGGTFIGINNRDLRTLVTDLAVSEHLLPKVPPGIFAISESGMREVSDIVRLRAAGAHAFLIGEALMRSEDPKELIASRTRVGTRIKFCGCTSWADVEMAVEAGADAVGVIFAESPRRITWKSCARSSAAFPRT